MNKSELIELNQKRISELIELNQKQISELQSELLALQSYDDDYERVTYELHFMHGDADIYTNSQYVTHNKTEIRLLNYIASTKCKEERSYYNIFNYDESVVESIIKDDESLKAIINGYDNFERYLYGIKFLVKDEHFIDSDEPASIERIVIF